MRCMQDAWLPVPVFRAEISGQCVARVSPASQQRCCILAKQAITHRLLSRRYVDGLKAKNRLLEQQLSAARGSNERAPSQDLGSGPDTL